MRQHDEGQERMSRVKDAQSKIDLLRTEINFNNDVLNCLRRLKDNRASLDSAEQAYHENHILQSATHVERIQNQLKQEGDLHDVRVTQLLQKRLGKVHDNVLEKLQRMLLAFLKVEQRGSHPGDLVLRCSHHVEGKHHAPHLWSQG